MEDTADTVDTADTEVSVLDKAEKAGVLVVDITISKDMVLSYLEQAIMGSVADIGHIASLTNAFVNGRMLPDLIII